MNDLNKQVEMSDLLIFMLLTLSQEMERYFHIFAFHFA